MRVQRTKKERKKGMFYLTTHSTHFNYGYIGVGHMTEDHSDSERRNPLSLTVKLNIVARFANSMFNYTT